MPNSTIETKSKFFQFTVQCLESCFSASVIFYSVPWHWSLSMPPENIRKTHVFRGYWKRSAAWNGLIKTQDERRFKSSRSRAFFKICILKNFANFTGKHLCWSAQFPSLQYIRCWSYSGPNLNWRLVSESIFGFTIIFLILKHLVITGL